MRKDIFIVGARLLGIWELIGAVSSFGWIITGWLGYVRPQSYSQEYYSVRFIIELAVGLYLLFRTHHLFHLMERLEPDNDEAQVDEHDISQAE